MNYINNFFTAVMNTFIALFVGMFIYMMFLAYNDSTFHWIFETEFEQTPYFLYLLIHNLPNLVPMLLITGMEALALYFLYIIINGPFHNDYQKPIGGLSITVKAIILMAILIMVKYSSMHTILSDHSNNAFLIPFFYSPLSLYTTIELLPLQLVFSHISLSIAQKSGRKTAITVLIIVSLLTLGMKPYGTHHSLTPEMQAIHDAISLNDAAIVMSLGLFKLWGISLKASLAMLFISIAIATGLYSNSFH